MKDKVIRFFDAVIYWAMVLMPFSVAISPGLANACIGLFCSFFIFKKVAKWENPFPRDFALLPYALLMLVALLSFKNSLDYGDSLNGMVKLLKYGLILLVCSQELRDAQHVRRIIISVACGVCLISVDGLWQMMTGKDFIHGIEIQSSYIQLARPTASFPNPNIMAVYLAALVPLIVALALRSAKGKGLVWSIVVSLIGACGVVITFSRGAGLGFYIAILTLAIMSRRWLVSVGLVALLVSFPFVMPQNIRDWAKEIRYNPLVFMFNEDRLAIYMNTTNMIAHHPVVGVGVNTFSQNYGKYKTAKAEAYWKTPDTIYAHNNFMQMAGEIGLLGVGMFLWFLFMLFKNIGSAYRRAMPPFLKAVSAGLLVSVIAFLINGITETSLYYPRVSMIFWFLAGLALAMKRIIKIPAT